MLDYFLAETQRAQRAQSVYSISFPLIQHIYDFHHRFLGKEGENSNENSAFSASPRLCERLYLVRFL